MKPLLLPALFLSAALAAAFPADARDGEKTVSVRELPKKSPYVDPATGTVFPPVIGTFRKISVTENANPVFGTVVRYAGATGESADIYLFSPGAEAGSVAASDLPVQFGKAKKQIGSAVFSKGNPPRKLVAEESVSILSESVMTDEKGTPLACRCSFAYSIADDPFVSELILLRAVPEGKPSKLVKLRLSRPAEADEAGKAAEEFIRELCGKLTGKACVFRPADGNVLGHHE